MGPPPPSSSSSAAPRIKPTQPPLPLFTKSSRNNKTPITNNATTDNTSSSASSSQALSTPQERRRISTPPPPTRPRQHLDIDLNLSISLAPYQPAEESGNKPSLKQEPMTTTTAGSMNAMPVCLCLNSLGYRPGVECLCGGASSRQQEQWARTLLQAAPCYRGQYGGNRGGWKHVGRRDGRGVKCIKEGDKVPRRSGMDWGAFGFLNDLM
ncbi:hypothetical protein EJB05_28692, partial [Eragrostis curvula]